MTTLIPSTLRPALVLFLLLTLVTGVAYPALVTVLGQALFAEQARGSLVVEDGKVVGSSLVGQQFADPKHFWGRPSATSPAPYNGALSSGSNLGPTHPALLDAVKGRIEALRAADPGNMRPVPIDLVTASASGLDPHISLAAARYQAPRVARLRQLPLEQVNALIDAHAEHTVLGFLGEERVNVLALNLALGKFRP